MDDNRSFFIFPWQQAFLPALKDFIADQTGSRPGRALIIVPNQRPWRYLGDLYAKEKKAGALPRMLPVSRIASIWSAFVSGSPYCMANQLDSVRILRGCVADLSAEDELLSARFSKMSMAHFLPWGLRLANLLEEIFLQGREPEDITHIEGEVAKLAEPLLGALGRIGAVYRQRLEKHDPKLMTPGLESLEASKNAADIPPYLQPANDRPVFIAGFAALNGAEEKLFKSLWQAGAKICLNGDPALAEGGQTHYAARSQVDWIRRWHAETVLVNKPLLHDPECTFYAAYDEHSQIDKMASDIEQKDGAASTAIILPDPALLMPVLHQLPDKDINISMGYPLKRTQLQSFFDDIFQLQLRRSPNGGYYWRDLLRLLHQPYLKFLVNAEEEGKSLYLAVGRVDNIVRSQGIKYISLQAVLSKCAEERNGKPILSIQEIALLQKIFDLLIEAPATMRTTADIATVFGGICNSLIEYGGKRWKYFSLDAEALSRVQNNVLPVLKENLLSGETFSMQVLYQIFESLFERERIPFEADPITGKQILGLLETRLLQFDNLFILDASEDLLPGSYTPDPLLPDSLRPVAGLPDIASRQKVVDYNFFRLFFGSKKAHFYWSEGGALSRLGPGRRFRSRYIDQLVWKHEQKLGKLLKPGEEPLGVAAASARLNRRSARSIERTPELDKKMRSLLSSGISPSMLNSYIKCPAGFVLERLLCLQKPNEIGDRDSRPTGNCIHLTLANLLRPYKGKKLKLKDVPLHELESCFRDSMKELDMARVLAVEDYLILEKTGISQLKKYLDGQDEEIIIREIEHEIRAPLIFRGNTYLFKGKVDRLDSRDGRDVITDYKSGNIYAPEGDFLWNKPAFFAALESYINGSNPYDDEAEDLLRQLQESLPDIQMPVYLLMQEQVSGNPPANAVWVDLKDKGTEIPLVSDSSLENQIIANCRTAVDFLLWHMENVTVFSAPETNCKWCGYADACKI